MASGKSRVRIEYRGRMYTKVKGWTKAVKAGLGGIIVDPWWKKYLPLHFGTQAYFRYGDKGRGAGAGVFKKRFRKRSREQYLEDVRTMGREGARAKKYELRAPMVWTGELKRRVLGIQPRLSGTAKAGVRGYLRGSNVANFHTGNNPKTGNYNMVAELRVVNTDEEREMAAALDLTLTGFLNEKGATEVKEL